MSIINSYTILIFFQVKMSVNEVIEDEFELETTIEADDQQIVIEPGTTNKLDLSKSEDSYWRYFEKPTDPKQEKVKCRTCGKSIARGSDQSTSALLKHLKLHHNKIFDLLTAARKKVPSIVTIKPEKLTKDSKQQITLLECQVNLISRRF